MRFWRCELSRVQEGALRRLPDTTPSPTLPSQKRVEGKMKAMGLLEATQSLCWLREALTKWGFLIKTNATRTCVFSHHLDELRLLLVLRP